MTAPITVARKAIARRAAAVSPLVRLTNTGVNPIGSMMTKSVTKEVINSVTLKSNKILNPYKHASLKSALQCFFVRAVDAAIVFGKARDCGKIGRPLELMVFG